MATAAIGTGVSLGLSALSGALTPTKTTFNETQVGKLEDVSTRKTGAGWSLGKPFGRVQIKGCPIFWAPQRREEVVTTTETSTSGGGKFGGGGQRTVNTTQTYKYYGTFAFAICDGAAGIDVRQIKFNDLIWYNKDGALSSTITDNDYKLENYLKIYSGTSNQTIDPTIQNYEGNQNGDRNFKHLCYCVVTDLPLDEFGGELPGTIDVVVLRDDTTGAEPYNRIDQVIYEVAESVGLTREVDIKCSGLVTSTENGVVNLTVNGLFKQDGQTAAEFINEIVQRYFLLCYLDNDGAIVFELPENMVNAVNKNFNQLGAIDYGSEPSDPYEEIMPDVSELPSSVTINYSNVNDDFNGDNENRNYPLAKHYNPKVINSALSMTRDEASWWSWKYIQFAWTWARRFTVKLLPEDTIGLTEGTKLIIPLVDGEGGEGAVTFQIASIVFGGNYIGEIEVYSFDGSAFIAQPDINKVYNLTAYNGGTIQLSPNITSDVFVTSCDGQTTYVEGSDYTVDKNTGQITVVPGGNITAGSCLNFAYSSKPDATVNPVNPNNEQPDYGEPVVTVVETNRIRPSDNPCIYAAITRDGNDFGTTTIYGRLNSGSYQSLATVLLPTAKGTLTGTLALATGLDITNTATVVMTEGILESLSQFQFDNHEVILLIGDEQIVARDVTLISPNTYQLNYLQRGVNGTPPVAHVNDETVYIAKGTNDSLAIIPIDATLIGQNIDLKAVPNNVTLADVLTVTSHTIQGIYYKPYAPSNATATKDSAGNITTINWDGNNTGLNELFPQSYEIDIYNGINIVRTISIGEKTTSYLIDDQIADFGSIQSTITIAIYQLSTEFGRGYVYDVVLDPVLVDPIPTITSFSPTQGDIGDAITIYGAGFTSATSAAINGTNITSFTVIDDEKISGVVDIGTTTGSITVVNAAGTGVSLSDFVVVNIGFSGGVNGGIGSLRYTKIIGDLTIPPVGGTVNVTVEKPDIFGPAVPVMITYEVATPGIGLAQLFVTQVNGNVVTLERWQEGIVQTEYFPASPLLIMSAIVERYSGVFGGVLNADWLSTGGYSQILNLPETFPPSAHTHPHNHTVSVYISIPEGGGTGGGTYTTSIDATVNDNNNSGDPGGISIDLTGFMQYDTYDPGRNGVIDFAENINGINAAGNSKYYGTDGAGTAGFYDLPADVAWGNITGTLADQTDLQTALDSKFDTPTGTTEEYLAGDGSLVTFPSLTVEKTHTTHSLLSNGLVTLTLQSEYFHFVDPINYDGTVYLPAVTANDYFECEIINSGDGSKRVVIVENDDTNIITLGIYAGTRYRSVYIYWDGTIWQVWVRGYY